MLPIEGTRLNSDISRVDKPFNHSLTCPAAFISRNMISKEPLPNNLAKSANLPSMSYRPKKQSIGNTRLSYVISKLNYLIFDRIVTHRDVIN